MMWRDATRRQPLVGLKVAVGVAAVGVSGSDGVDQRIPTPTCHNRGTGVGRVCCRGSWLRRVQLFIPFDNTSAPERPPETPDTQFELRPFAFPNIAFHQYATLSLLRLLLHPPFFRIQPSLIQLTFFSSFVPHQLQISVSNKHLFCNKIQNTTNFNTKIKWWEGKWINNCFEYWKSWLETLKYQK